MKTRKEDLEVLEQARSDARTKEEKKHFESLEVQIYEQMKDPYIESKRMELVDAMRRQDFKAHMRIQQEVQEYAKSPAFKKRMADRIEKQVSRKEAEVYFKKQ